MRFIFAIVCFVLAALMMGLGIGERTFLAGPDEITASTTKTASAPVTVVDGSALTAYKQTQTVQLSGSKSIAAAYGRTSDVLAWVGDTTYTHVTFNAKTGKLVSTVVHGDASTVPPLPGSDLWLHEYAATSTLRLHVDLPKSMSVIAASDGKKDAPSVVSITWPLDNSAPWSEPLVAGGAGVLLLGLVLLIWALAHMRSTRGPRRKQIQPPKMPKLPRQPRYKPNKPKAIAAVKGRRATRRMVAIVPVLVIGSIALAGCTSSGSAAPSSAATATPTSTDAAPAANLQAPAVSEAQATHIIASIAAVVAQADTTRNTALIATRVAGPALQLRLANYAIRTADASLPAVAPIPAGPLELILPQQGDTWPRTIFAVIQNKADAATAPIAMMLVQDDARSNYKVQYSVTLEPDVKLPEVASASVGAARLSPDIKLLQLAPAAVAADYGDVLMTDKASKYFSAFSPDGDTLRTQVGLAAKNARIAALPTTAKLTYSNAAGPGQVIALSTNDSGAIVAVQLNETETVTPVKAGAVVQAPGAIKALFGSPTSTKGIVATYSDQLLFYVPSANEPSKIALLGFSQGLIQAKETP